MDYDSSWALSLGDFILIVLVKSSIPKGMPGSLADQEPGGDRA